jgi:hypothetical protein
VDKRQAIEKAYKSLSLKKQTVGFKMGYTDCFTLVLNYHCLLIEDESLKRLNWRYTSDKTLNKFLNKLGYENFVDLFIKEGYSELDPSKDSPQLGDISFKLLKPYNTTAAIIYLGQGYWLTSAANPEHDKFYFDDFKSLSKLGRPPE